MSGSHPLAVNFDVIIDKANRLHFLEQGSVLNTTRLLKPAGHAHYPNVMALKKMAVKKVYYFSTSPDAFSPFDLRNQSEIKLFDGHKLGKPDKKALKKLIKEGVLSAPCLLDTTVYGTGGIVLSLSTLRNYMASPFYGRKNFLQPEVTPLSENKLAFELLARRYDLPRPRTYIISKDASSELESALTDASPYFIIKPIGSSMAMGVVLVARDDLPALAAYLRTGSEKLLIGSLASQAATLAQLLKLVNTEDGVFLIQQAIVPAIQDGFRAATRLFVNLQPGVNKYVTGYHKRPIEAAGETLTPGSLISDSEYNKQRRAHLFSSGEVASPVSSSGSEGGVYSLDQAQKLMVAKTLSSTAFKTFSAAVTDCSTLAGIIDFLRSESNPLLRNLAPRLLVTGFYHEAAFAYLRTMPRLAQMQYLARTLVQQITLLKLVRHDQEKKFICNCIGAIKAKMFDVLESDMAQIICTQAQYEQLQFWLAIGLDNEDHAKGTMARMFRVAEVATSLSDLAVFSANAREAFGAANFMLAKGLYLSAANLAWVNDDNITAATGFKNAAVCADRLSDGPSAIRWMQQAIDLVRGKKREDFATKQMAYMDKYPDTSPTPTPMADYFSTPPSARADAGAGAGAGAGCE